MSEENESRIINSANYPPNKKRSLPTDGVEKKEKKVEKIVESTVVQRKKPLGKKLTETFTGEDARSVGHYLVFDVLVPATKTLIFDLISQGTERTLFGTTSGARPRGAGARRVQYDRMYSGNTRSELDRPGGVRNMSSRARATHDFDEIVIEDRGEADEILERLQDLINDYEVATVSDLYDLVGITSTIQDEKWGWTSIKGASITRVREGYLLNMPRTESLS